MIDDLLGDGIPEGSSILVSGVAGTSKTAMLLEAQRSMGPALAMPVRVWVETNRAACPAGWSPTKAT